MHTSLRQHKHNSSGQQSSCESSQRKLLFRRPGTCDVVGEWAQYAQMDSIVLSGILRIYLWSVQIAKGNVEGLAAAATGDSRKPLKVSGKGLLHISVTRYSREEELARIPCWNDCGAVAMVS